jgi:hypothetical protein
MFVKVEPEPKRAPHQIISAKFQQKNLNGNTCYVHPAGRDAWKVTCTFFYGKYSIFSSFMLILGVFPEGVFSWSGHHFHSAWFNLYSVRFNISRIM